MERYLKTPLGQKSAISSSIDKSALCAIARNGSQLRADGKFANLPMSGQDIWNAYELSWLSQQGLPRFAVCRIAYECSSPNIVESKSLKLYLGSFFDTRFEDASQVSARIKTDLSSLLLSEVEVEILSPFAKQSLPLSSLDPGWSPIDVNIVSFSDGKIVRDNNVVVRERLYWGSFRSLCPVTGQPDWATIFIDYSGFKMEHGALLGYLMKYRTHASFHEEVCEQIFYDIYLLLEPTHLMVRCNFLRRGGIDINPIRFTKGFADNLIFERLPQQ